MEFPSLAIPVWGIILLPCILLSSCCYLEATYKGLLVCDMAPLPSI